MDIMRHCDNVSCKRHSRLRFKKGEVFEHGYLLHTAVSSRSALLQARQAQSSLPLDTTSSIVCRRPGQNVTPPLPAQREMWISLW